MSRDNGTLSSHQITVTSPAGISAGARHYLPAGRGPEASDAHLATPSVRQGAQLHVCSSHLPLISPGPRGSSPTSNAAGAQRPPWNQTSSPAAPPHGPGGQGDSGLCRALPHHVAPSCNRRLVEGLGCRLVQGRRRPSGDMAPRTQDEQGKSEDLSAAKQTGLGKTQCPGALALLGGGDDSTISQAAGGPRAQHLHRPRAPRRPGMTAAAPSLDDTGHIHRQDVGVCTPHPERPPARAGPSMRNGASGEGQDKAPWPAPPRPPHSLPPTPEGPAPFRLGEPIPLLSLAHIPELQNTESHACCTCQEKQTNPKSWSVAGAGLQGVPTVSPGPPPRPGANTQNSATLRADLSYEARVSPDVLHGPS